MSTDRDLVIELLEGTLDGDRELQLAQMVQDDPELSSLVIEELRLSDLMARELDPSRNDGEFVWGLFTRLDIDPGGGGPDGGDASGEAGPEDGTGADGTGADGASVDGTNAGSGLETSLPDPGSVSAVAKAGGNAVVGGGAAAVGTGGGLLGWAVAGAVAVAIGTTAVVMQRTPEPAPPASETVGLDADASASALAKILPTADVFLFGRWKKNDGSLPTLEVAQGEWWKHTRTAHMQFDLSQVPRQFERARLRLYCLSTAEEVQPLGIWQTQDKWSEEAPDKPIDWREGKESFAKWLVPQAESYWEIDVTDIVRTEQAGDGIVSFVIGSLLQRTEVVGKPEGTSFASREHENLDWRPVLIIE